MLEKQRKRIDEIDREFVRLFEERTKTVEEVAEIKLEHNMRILDRTREQAVIEKTKSFLNDDSLEDEVADLFENIMRISREHQEEWMKKQ